VSEDASDRDETGQEPSAWARAEPSAAEASRALAQRLRRDSSVVAHGTIPFRSGPGPRPGRRRGTRVVLVVGVVLAAVFALAVVVALLVS
jgi:hypothetical protein